MSADQEAYRLSQLRTDAPAFVRRNPVQVFLGVAFLVVIGLAVFQAVTPDTQSVEERIADECDVPVDSLVKGKTFTRHPDSPSDRFTQTYYTSSVVPAFDIRHNVATDDGEEHIMCYVR